MLRHILHKEEVLIKIIFVVVIGSKNLSQFVMDCLKIRRKNTNATNLLKGTVFMEINAIRLGYYSSCIFPSWRQRKLQLKLTNCNISFQFTFKAHNWTRSDLDAARIGIVFITFITGWRYPPPSKAGLNGVNPLWAGLDGVPPPSQDWMGYPPPPPRRSSRASTCYAAGVCFLFLAFTQEDFLVFKFLATCKWKFNPDEFEYMSHLEVGNDLLVTPL